MPIGNFAYTASSYTFNNIQIDTSNCPNSAVPAPTPGSAYGSCLVNVNVTGQGTVNNAILTFDFFNTSNHASSNPIDIDFTPGTWTGSFSNASRTGFAPGVTGTVFYTLTNPPGNPPLIFTSFSPTLGGNDPDAFEITVAPGAGTTCNTTTPLAANSSCTYAVDLQAQPTTENNPTAILNLAVETNGGNPSDRTISSSPLKNTTGTTQWGLNITTQPLTTIAVGNTTTAVYKVINITDTASLIFISATPNASSPALSSLQIVPPTIPGENGCAIIAPLVVSGALTPGASCYLAVQATGAADGTSNIGLTVVTANGSNGSAATQTVNSNDIQVGTGLAALTFTSQPRAAAMDIASRNQQNQVLTYEVQNNTNDELSFTTGLKNLASNPIKTHYLAAEHLDNDCDSHIAAGGSCHITLTLVPGTSYGLVDQILTVTAQSEDNRKLLPLLAPLTFQVASATNARNITFVNQCAAPIWLGLNSAPVANKACKQDSDCLSGASCELAGAHSTTKKCVWIAPTPVLNSNNPGNKDGNPYELKTGDSSTLTLNDPRISSAILKGQTAHLLFAARTGCDQGGHCQSADCSGNNALPGWACAPGTDFSAPATVGEFKLYNGMQGVLDTYGLNFSTGYNIPFAITPNAEATPDSTGSPDSCGIAGGITEQGSSAKSIAPCSWNFNWGVSASFNPNMKAVSTGGAACSSDQTCNSTQVCGLSQQAIQTASSGTPATSCGTFLGYWSASQICSLNSALTAPVNCGQLASTQQNFAQVFAAACPSANTGSSGSSTPHFTCSNNQGAPAISNTLGYTVTFCPGNTATVPSATQPAAR